MPSDTERVAPLPASIAETTSAPSAPSAPSSPVGHGMSVSARPRYRSNPKPDYPIDSLRHREEGVVLLKVDVTVDGMAAAVALKQSSGFSALDVAAIEAVHHWTFEAALADGLPIASQVVVPVRFSLSNR